MISVIPGSGRSLPINMVCPLNWLHQLNQGLIGNWRALPKQNQGNRLINFANTGATGNHGSAVIPSLAPPAPWAPTNRPGGWGQADLGNGADPSYIIVADDPLLDCVKTTWAVWIKQDTEQDFAFIMARNDGSTGHILQARSADNVYRFGIRVGAAQHVVASTTDPVNRLGLWTHLAGTYDGETELIYVNGVLEGTNATPSGDIDAISHALAFGRESDLGTGTSLNAVYDGAIDDARIYNRALSASEIALLYRLSQEGYPGMYNLADRWGSSWSLTSSGTVYTFAVEHSLDMLATPNIETPETLASATLTQNMEVTHSFTLTDQFVNLEHSVGFKQRFTVRTNGAIASGRFKEKAGQRDG